MTRATLVNRLKAEGSIEQVRVNRYRINDTSRVRGLGITVGLILTLNQVHEKFLIQIGPTEGDWHFRTPTQRSEPTSTYRAPEQQRTVLRRITRNGYHSSGSGADRNGVQEALARISTDDDGVRRSFGLEWEIYALTETQEDALARLLDTLPPHYTERDGSLGSTGVEIVFLPLEEGKIKQVWNTLTNFCRTNNVSMGGTGAHLTYGVSNSETTVQDLQIRLNRAALAVKSVATQRAIKEVFGRDFTGYARLPQSTTYSEHSNAFSARRGEAAWECRLCSYGGNIDKIVEFLKGIECVFHRPFNAQDFLGLFSTFGSDTAGA